MYSALDKAIMKFMNEEILGKDASAEKKQLLEEEILGRYDAIKLLCTIGSVYVVLEGKKTVEDYDKYHSQYLEDNSGILKALVDCFFRFHGRGDKVGTLVTGVEVVNGSVGFKITHISDEGAKQLKKSWGKKFIETLCDGCHKASLLDNLKKCGNCKTVSYCSRECQKADWKAHKPRCCVAH